MPTKIAKNFFIAFVYLFVASVCTPTTIVNFLHAVEFADVCTRAVLGDIHLNFYELRQKLALCTLLHHRIVFDKIVNLNCSLNFCSHFLIPLYVSGTTFCEL